MMMCVSGNGEFEERSRLVGCLLERERGRDSGSSKGRICFELEARGFLVGDE